MYKVARKGKNKPICTMISFINNLVSLGTLLCSVGLIGAGISLKLNPSLLLLYIMIGVLQGTGTAFMRFTSIDVIQFYFVRYKIDPFISFFNTLFKL